jgi:cell wall-associated NlpC family hydrolase
MHRATRGATVLAVCLSLAAASLGAAHGRRGRGTEAAVLSAARSHLGDRYVWGAVGPRAFDCSGLVVEVWGRQGHVPRVPRTSAQQQAWAVPIPAEQALPGDLVFFGAPVTHVGLVIGRLRGVLQMIDASSSRHGVVRRTVWSSGVVRFGRVPRRGMPRVRPWRPRPVSHPVAITRPLVSPHDPRLHGRRPLVGLAAHPAPATARARLYVLLARHQVGRRTWTDDGLVTALWRRAGGTVSPPSRAAIRHRTHRVLLAAARPGDLVVYPAPTGHVGIYVGGGWMVDASRSAGRVLLRPVWDAPGVQLVRWSR